MTRYCIETASPFGIVLIREGLEVGASEPGLRRGRGAGRDSQGQPLRRRPLRPAGGGHRPVRARGRRPGERAIPRRRSPGSTTRSATRTPPRSWRPRTWPLRPVPRAAPAAGGRDGDERDIGVELETANSPAPSMWTARRQAREVEEVDQTVRRGCSSPTTRRRCRTCSRGSCRSSCRDGRRCWRPRRPSNGWYLLELIDREILLLRRRLRLFTPDLGSRAG